MTGSFARQRPEDETDKRNDAHDEKRQHLRSPRSRTSTSAVGDPEEGDRDERRPDEIERRASG